MRSAPPKTLGGYRIQNFTPPVTGGAPNNFPMHLNRRAGNIPLFIRCGACRALLELKMLWPYVIGTPENPRGVENVRTQNFANPFSQCYTYRTRIINLYFCIAGPIGHFWN